MGTSPFRCPRPSTEINPHPVLLALSTPPSRTRVRGRMLGRSPLDPAAFNNDPPPPPLFERGSYRGTIFLLLIVAFIYLSVDTTAGVVMILAVLASLIGSYTSSKAQRKMTRRATGWMSMLLGGGGGPSKTVLGTSGGGLVTYALVFLSYLPN